MKKELLEIDNWLLMPISATKTNEIIQNNKKKKRKKC